MQLQLLVQLFVSGIKVRTYIHFRSCKSCRLFDIIQLQLATCHLLKYFINVNTEVIASLGCLYLFEPGCQEMTQRTVIVVIPPRGNKNENEILDYGVCSYFQF